MQHKGLAEVQRVDECSGLLACPRRLLPNFLLLLANIAYNVVDCLVKGFAFVPGLEICAAHEDAIIADFQEECLRRSYEVRLPKVMRTKA